MTAVKKEPLVSIVIPLYNGSNYIEQAIESALVQDYENIEILVINDGSTDQGAGRDICMRYADRIKYMEKPNGGCASALNYGILAANGEYISWLSHDDLYEPNKISHQISLLNQKGLDPNCTIISNAGRLIDGEGNPIYHPAMREKNYLRDIDFFRHLLFKYCVNGCGMLIPRRLFLEGLSFNEQMRFVLDWNLWLKMAASGVGAYIDDTVLVGNRVHGEQVTVKQKELHQKETHQTVSELFVFLKDKPAEYMKELYYFAYAKRDSCAREIREYLIGNGQKISKRRGRAFRLKETVKDIAKKVYHAIR